MINKTKKIFTFFAQGALLLFAGFLITQSIGIGAKVFDIAGLMGTFNYYVVGIGFMLGLSFLFIAQLIDKKEDKKYGNSVAFSSPGERPALSFFGRFSSIQIFMLSVIIFGVFGLFAFVSKMESFTGTIIIGEQFTAQSELLFSTLLVCISENLGAAFVIGLMLFLLGMWARKIKMNTATFTVIAIFLIPLICAIYGVANHLTRYGSSDISLLIVFFFWLIGGILTVATGSFLPFFVLHMSNNFFVDMQRLFTSDITISYTIGFLIVFTMLYGVIYRKRMFGRTSATTGI